MTKPTILQTQRIATTRLFAVESVHLRYGNGQERHYERLVNQNNGAVLVVPLTADNQLVLIREYGAGTEDYQLGFPKGKIDDGESAEKAAWRECQEEVGFQPGRLTPLKFITTSPGYMNHGIHSFLAEDLTPAKIGGDEPEPLEVITWPLKDWARLLDEPDFTEGRSLASLTLVAHQKGLI